jgi:hypothetical protein
VSVSLCFSVAAGRQLAANSISPDFAMITRLLASLLAVVAISSFVTSAAASSSKSLSPLASSQRHLLTTGTWPNPYLEPISAGTVGSLVFQLGTQLGSGRIVSTNTTYFDSLLKDIRKAYGLYDVAEELRLTMTGPVSTSSNVLLWTILLGPAVGRSLSTSVDLYQAFYTLAFLDPSPLVVRTAYPTLSGLDRKTLAVVSYACDDGDVKTTFTLCEDSGSGGSSKGWIVAVAVVVGVGVLICLGIVCLKLAKKRPAELNNSEEAPPREEVQMSAPIVNVFDAAAAPHYYPGAPNRLSDGLPSNVVPVKYGFDEGPEGEEPDVAPVVTVEKHQQVVEIEGAEREGESADREEGEPGAPAESAPLQKQERSLESVTIHVQQ